MTQPKLNVAIIGCGNIADGYARNLITLPQVHLAGATDIDFARAEALTRKYGGKVYPTLEALLADPAIDLVIDLIPSTTPTMPSTNRHWRPANTSSAKSPWP